MQGVYPSKKKDGTPYYRSSIHYLGVHISLGSFDTEKDAHRAYKEASKLYHNPAIKLTNFRKYIRVLPQDKVVTILNHRDHKIYIKTPIYLRNGYFSYYLENRRELKFDNDDLFYYSSHRILCRQGHLYVNDYGMQYSILQRFGIKNYAVAGKDYTFANGDSNDFRYSNIIVVNKYHGVTLVEGDGAPYHQVKIHINGDYTIGQYRNDAIAAVAYNKAADYARDHGVQKQFIQNYVVEYSPKEYADVYSQIHLPKKYRNYIKELTGTIK